MIWISFCRFYACICDFNLMAKRVEMLLICSSYFFIITNLFFFFCYKLECFLSSSLPIFIYIGR